LRQNDVHAAPSLEERDFARYLCDEALQVDRRLPPHRARNLELSRAIEAIRCAEDPPNPASRHAQEGLKLFCLDTESPLDLVEGAQGDARRPAQLVRDAFEKGRPKVSGSRVIWTRSSGRNNRVPIGH
jgi:hypothetical protein